MITVNTKYFFVLWTIAAIAACDQSEPPDDLDEVNPDDYYPLVDGATWTYRHSSKGGWEETVTMHRSDDDEDTYIASDTSNPDGERTESAMIIDGTSVYRISKTVFLDDQPQFSVVYDPGFLRFDFGWLDKDETYEDTREYKRTETETGESPKTPRDREHTFVIEEKNAEVTVSGKLFRDCVIIKRKKEAVLDETGSIQSDEQEKLFWFAPHVGKVKEVNLSSGNFEELLEYEIP